jgi:hypothetical protein
MSFWPTHLSWNRSGTASYRQPTFNLLDVCEVDLILTPPVIERDLSLPTRQTLTIAAFGLPQLKLPA